MKHDLKVIYYLVLIFIVAQVVGLFLLNQSIETINVDSNTGNIKVEYSDSFVERPEMEGQESFIYIISMIFIGTFILLMIIKFKMFKVWKAWFFLAIWGSLSIALSVIMDNTLAIILSGLLTYLKLNRPNAIIHNFTEIFIYAGIAILISPMFDLYWAVLLLVAISIYDVIAVWQSKHMIKLATAQSENKMFAGLLIPYESEKKTKKINVKKVNTKIHLKVPKGFKEKTVKSAILGGGDVAFPMLFAGAVMTDLIQTGFMQSTAYFYSLLIPFGASIALFLLFLKSQKGKFYPAMPFISLGCFFGFFLMKMVLLL
jgi:presenilin-like A22 family membrane protease